MMDSDLTAQGPRRTYTIWALLACAALAVGLIGCGPAADAKYKVTGSVKFDQQPVQQGMAIFYPADSGADADVAEIRDGKFEAEIKAGRKRVEITANREIVPRRLGPMGGPDMEQYIPAKFNSKSELTADVIEDNNEINFDLKSK